MSQTELLSPRLSAPKIETLRGIYRATQATSAAEDDSRPPTPINEDIDAMPEFQAAVSEMERRT